LAYNEVKKFHQAFNHPVGDCPTPLDFETRMRRGLWILEEVIEGIVSASVHKQIGLLKQIPEGQEGDLEVMVFNELEDVVARIYVAAQLGTRKAAENILDKIHPEYDNNLWLKDLKDQVDADVDVLYFTLGNLVQMGVKPQKIFEAVQKANMGKLHEDGKPRYDPANGNKIVKPATWKSPDEDIEAELLTQMNNYIDDKD
jgi:energy-coupling factor transport system permease protein